MPSVLYVVLYRSPRLNKARVARHRVVRRYRPPAIHAGAVVHQVGKRVIVVVISVNVQVVDIAHLANHVIGQSLDQLHLWILFKEPR
jgi:hypothetical protein